MLSNAAQESPSGGYTIVVASPADHEPIVRMLAEFHLPGEDLTTAHLEHFVVLRDRGGAVRGCAGLELFGPNALMRSLAVDADLHGRGWGTKLVEEVEELARRSEVQTIYLLTETAESYMAKRGYRRTDRSALPEGVSGSEEVRHLCPESAVCMVRELTRRTGTGEAC